AVGGVVDQLTRGQGGRRPALIVPVAAEDPFARLRSRALGDPPRELGRRAGVLQVDVLELRAAVDEVDVRVVEAGNHTTPAAVDRLRVRAAPSRGDVLVADVDDALADDRQRGGVRLLRVAGPDGGVADDEGSGGGAPPPGGRPPCAW